jgi:hypothetical protein
VEGKYGFGGFNDEFSVALKGMREER